MRSWFTIGVTSQSDGRVCGLHVHQRPLVHVFLPHWCVFFTNTPIDYCNAVLAGSPRTVTDKLQRVLNAAARVVTDTWKFVYGLCQILHDELHWLDAPDRVFFKLAVTVHWCMDGCAPPYLSDYCVRAVGADTRQQLRSANLQQLATGSTLTAVRPFQLPAPVWNSLPDFMRDPTISADCFRRLLTTYLFARY